MHKKTIRGLSGLVAGLLTASGTFKALNHDTTALLLFIAAIVLFFITASVWLTQRTLDFRTNIKGASNKSPVIAPANTSSLNPSPPWNAYIEDVFHGVIWRWHYKPQIDNTPRNITPYCPECENPQPLHYTSGAPYNKDTREGKSLMNCPKPGHRQMYLIPVELDEHFGMFANIKREIQNNLERDKWKETTPLS